MVVFGPALFAQTKSIFRERNTIYLVIIMTCDPSIYIMDYTDCFVSSLMDISISLKWVNIFILQRDKKMNSKAKSTSRHASDSSSDMDSSDSNTPQGI